MQKIVVLFLVVFLVSCGGIRNSNFSHQKYTDLKKKKIDILASCGLLDSTFEKEKNYTENYHDENEHDSLLQPIVMDGLINQSVNSNFCNIFADQPSIQISTDSTKKVICQAIDDNRVFLVEINGRCYRLDSAQYNDEQRSLKGNLVVFADVDSFENDATIEIIISKYDIIENTFVNIDLDDMITIDIEDESILSCRKTGKIRKPQTYSRFLFTELLVLYSIIGIGLAIGIIWVIVELIKWLQSF